MSNNVKIALYRGTSTDLASLASTGQAGVLAWTTDTNELYVDQGTGTGIGALGSGAAWVLVSAVSNLQELAAPVANQFVTYIDQSGVQHTAQVSFAEISGLLAQTQLPASISAGSSLTLIDCGTF